MGQHGLAIGLAQRALPDDHDRRHVAHGVEVARGHIGQRGAVRCRNGCATS
jgi:hypothetical protein